MKPQRKLLVIAALLSLFSVTVGIYSVNVGSVTFRRQSVPMFVLQSSENDALSSSFISDLAVASSKDNKDVFLFREDTKDITVIDKGRKTEKISSAFPFAKALAVNSQGRIFVAGISELTVSDAKGNRLSNFPIPAATTSLAALNDGGIAIAAADSDGLLTVFDASGKTSRRIGSLKKLDIWDAAQNRFLNSGKVATNQSGELYHVSTFSPTPVVQKFSKQGELSKEFTIEGAAVELQLKRAKEFLKQRKSSCIGGYYVIRSASVDPTTGNLWIGMNGLSETGLIRPESGVLYEYNSDGEKLAEYALEVVSRVGKTNILTDIKDIAVNAPYAYVLTSTGQVYRFDLNQRSAVTPKEPEAEQRNSLVSFIRAGWKSLFSPTVSAQPEPCPTGINYTCNSNCPTGSSPQSVDCGAELTGRLNRDEVVISSSCQTGTTVGQNGGCSGSITGCASNGVRVTYSTTILCNAAPTPTPTPEPPPEPTPEPTPETCGGGAGSCTAQDQYVCAAINLWCNNQTGCCDEPSPILIDVEGNGFALTDAANGVNFSMNGVGQGRVSWTAPNSDDAWLVLDRNGNGKIDNGTELFGNFTSQPSPPAREKRNGFLALAVYDRPQNGGNNDGVIDARDSVFASLRLWQDRNHNGISESNELQNLSQSDVQIIELRYRESRRTDEYGNRFRYRAKVRDARGAQVGRWAWDVFLVSER